MRRSACILSCILLFGCFFKRPLPNWDVQKVAHIFEQNHTTGTFVVYDVKADYLLMYNEVRSHQLFYPASTFKIVNSLIGLKTKVIHDEDEVFYRYDGHSKFFLKEWEKDASLRSGIKVSHVPAFQELAHRIGLQNMRQEISALDYGNREIGDNVENFWLKGPLKISAVQQAYFLAALAQSSLPYPEDVQENVRNICELEQGDGWVLYGKTGLASSEIPKVGWFVGWVNKKGRIYSFALNMDMTTNDAQDLNKRIILAKASLQALGVV